MWNPVFQEQLRFLRLTLPCGRARGGGEENRVKTMRNNPLPFEKNLKSRPGDQARRNTEQGVRRDSPPRTRREKDKQVIRQPGAQGGEFPAEKRGVVPLFFRRLGF